MESEGFDALDRQNDVLRRLDMGCNSPEYCQDYPGCPGCRTRTVIKIVIDYLNLVETKRQRGVMNYLIQNIERSTLTNLQVIELMDVYGLSK